MAEAPATSFWNFDTDALQKLALGLQGVGAVSSTFAAYNRSKAEKYGYEFQSKLARNNAEISEWQADDAKRRGRREEDKLRMRAASIKGAQIARMAANGIDLSQGTALNILTDTDLLAESDVLLARDNTAREVWGFKQQGANYRANADALKASADAVSPFSSAAGTLLTSAGSVAKSWYAMRTKTSL